MRIRSFGTPLSLCLLAALLCACQASTPGTTTPGALGSRTPPALTRPAVGSPTPEPSLTPALGVTPLMPPAPSSEEAGVDYVVVYSDTSRTESALAALMEERPGLVAETYTLSSQDVYLQLLADLDNLQPLADVYLVSDGPRTLSLLADGTLTNVPPAALFSALASDDREPLLTHHWTAVTWVSTGGATEEGALDSWWDLTRPEWAGRVALPDPTIDERTLLLLVAAAREGDAFAEAYEREFGRAIRLDADCPSAGWQWAKALMANEPRLVLNDAEVLAQLASAETTTGMAGLCGSEIWEKAARTQVALRPLVELEPAAGLKWRSYLAQVSSSPHPRAARLAIEWLMGDEAGGGGYSVWYKAGFYPARTDVPDPPGAPERALLEQGLWEVDGAGLEGELQAMRDLVTPYVGHPVGGR